MKNNNDIKTDFSDFRIMAMGPSVFSLPTNKGTLNNVVITGSCDNWNLNSENWVALDLGKHQYEVDMYTFGILSLKEMKCALVGWIYFDDLVKRAETIMENGRTYLTIQIKNLEPMEKLDSIVNKNELNTKKGF